MKPGTHSWFIYPRCVLEKKPCINVGAKTSEIGLPAVKEVQLDSSDSQEQEPVFP